MKFTLEVKQELKCKGKYKYKHLHRQFALQVTSKIIDQKFFSWQTKQLLESRICLWRPQYYLHVEMSSSCKHTKLEV